MAAIARVFTGENNQFIPLKNNTLLNTGDLIKFYFYFEEQAYLYIFYEDSHGNLALLFPKEIEKAKIRNLTPVYIPGGASWIELDHITGKETFHIIASLLQLEKLEHLYCVHTQLKEIGEIKQSTLSILSEIKSISRQSFKKQAEKPVRIAGKLRGDLGDDLSIQQEFFKSGIEVNANSVFVKTLTIDHK